MDRIAHTGKADTVPARAQAGGTTKLLRNGANARSSRNLAYWSINTAERRGIEPTRIHGSGVFETPCCTNSDSSPRLSLVPQAGLQPATTGLAGRCSMRLSYWGTLIFHGSRATVDRRAGKGYDKAKPARSLSRPTVARRGALPFRPHFTL